MPSPLTGVTLWILVLLHSPFTLAIPKPSSSSTSSPSTSSSSTSSSSTSSASTTPASGMCPATAPTPAILGCYGQPGCAYVIASDLGPRAACSANYCNCGGKCSIAAYDGLHFVTWINRNLCAAHHYHNIRKGNHKLRLYDAAEFKQLPDNYPGPHKKHRHYC